jgi:hypothetical protein
VALAVDVGRAHLAKLQLQIATDGGARAAVAHVPADFALATSSASGQPNTDSWNSKNGTYLQSLGHSADILSNGPIDQARPTCTAAWWARICGKAVGTVSLHYDEALNHHFSEPLKIALVK